VHCLEERVILDLGFKGNGHKQMSEMQFKPQGNPRILLPLI
jgi:hypothetical protein